MSKFQEMLELHRAQEWENHYREPSESEMEAEYQKLRFRWRSEHEDNVELELKYCFENNFTVEEKLSYVKFLLGEAFVYNELSGQKEMVSSKEYYKCLVKIQNKLLLGIDVHNRDLVGNKWIGDNNV